MSNEAVTQGDRHVRGMARGGGLNLVGALLSQASVFVVMLLLARKPERASSPVSDSTA